MAGADLDVAVIGDGPAGLALATACARAGLAVAVAGAGRPWTATYGVWRDDVADLPEHCFAHVAPSGVVHGCARRVLARPYGVLDNGALREHLTSSVDVAPMAMMGVQHFSWGSRVLTAGAPLDAKLVVDATGVGQSRPPRPHPEAPIASFGGGWPGSARRRGTSSRRPHHDTGQSAFGLVVERPPPGFDVESVTLMDLRPVAGAVGPPTFAYVVPVADGWLVEETVLAARPMVDSATLRDRLVARIGVTGEELVDAARRTEAVLIPMGGPLPSGREPTVGFGAAAGYVHPATGYSIASSLRAAPRVATAIAGATGDGRTDTRPVWEAVWSQPMRRTRRLHDYGLRVLLGLEQRELAQFFDAFFDLPTSRWSAYLRIDTPPAAVSATMAQLFARLPAPVRRRLLPWSRGT